jgi:hypothetical protein
LRRLLAFINLLEQLPVDIALDANVTELLSIRGTLNAAATPLEIL